MAIEDEIINIEDLEIAKEIKIGDQILLETTDGTKLIDFKDFIIGTDNITFYDKLSGGNFLQSKDISALEANFSTVSASVDTLTALGIESSIDSLVSRIQGVENSLNSLAVSLENVTNIPPEAVNPFTNSKVGFAVSTSGEYRNADNYIRFAKYDFKGSDLTTGTDISLGSGNSNFFYKAKGAYSLLINGSAVVKRKPVNASWRSTFKLKVGGRTLFEEDLLNAVNGGKFNVPPGQGWQTIRFSIVVAFSEGQRLTFSIGNPGEIRSMSVRGNTLS